MGPRGRMGLAQAVAMGLGGMIGAGIFSVPGVAGELAGGLAWIAFGLSGLLALLCARSFGYLARRYPTAGGLVEFLVRGLGDNVLTGGLTLMLWMGYVLAIALYASAFGHYAASFLPAAARETGHAVLVTGVVGGFVALNLAGAEITGRAELAIIIVKMTLLPGFAALVLPGAEPARLWRGQRRPCPPGRRHRLRALDSMAQPGRMCRRLRPDLRVRRQPGACRWLRDTRARPGEFPGRVGLSRVARRFLGTRST